MSAPSEPEKYSIDEMMERLKKRPGEDPIHGGELVTREDGSKAIRVRKRKRRSHQPHKEELQHNRRARMIQVSGALILLMLALLCSGAAIVFANSAPFREKLLKNITASSGATVDLKVFRMNPTSANASGITLTWPEGNVLRELATKNVRAEIFPASFLGKSMVGEEVEAIEGTLHLRAPQAGKPTRVSPATGDDSLPIRFKRYFIPKLHVLLGDPAAPLIRMMNSEGSFHPEGAGGRSQLLLSRGDLTINGWPKLQMDRSHIEFRGTEVDVLGMRLRHEGDARGVFELSGTISPYAADRASTLAVLLESFQLSGIAGPELGRLFSGRIDTDTRSSAKSNYLSFTPGPDPNSSLAIDFGNSITSTFEITGFPFLFGLSKTLDNKWFAKPVFESDVRGSLRRADGNVALSGLSFENKEYMALRGGVSVAPDRKLSGTLEVGVTEAMIEASKIRRLDAMFSPSRDGFRWVSLKVGGTAAAPTDNFKELFDAAETAETPAPANKIPSFEDLTQPE